MTTRQIFFVNILKNTFEGSDIWSAEYLKESISAHPAWTVSWASYDSTEEHLIGLMDAGGVFELIGRNGGHTGVLHLFHEHAETDDVLTPLFRRDLWVLPTTMLDV